jgi:sugar lactone lactonase YvrE
MLLAAATAQTHPGSRIVVDAQGQVYFAETGRIDLRIPGLIWRIEPNGQLSPIRQDGAHWMALDAQGSFADTDLRKLFAERVTPNLQRIPLADSKAALIQTDGVPIAIDGDGLYFARDHFEIARLSPDGTITLVTPNLRETAQKLGGIKGLATGPDGSLYITYSRAAQRLAPDGKLTTLVDSLSLAECDKDVPEGIPPPYLRGLSVDKDGVVFAAASGCRCVVKITPDGKTSVVLKAEAPWSPMGVAVHQGDLYVLEYAHPNAEQAKWQPRVRKLARDGNITTLATAPSADKK